MQHNLEYKSLGKKKTCFLLLHAQATKTSQMKYSGNFSNNSPSGRSKSKKMQSAKENYIVHVHVCLKRIYFYIPDNNLEFKCIFLAVLCEEEPSVGGTILLWKSKT